MIKKLDRRITVEEIIAFLSELPDDTIAICDSEQYRFYCNGIDYNHDKKIVLLTVNEDDIFDI